MCAVDDGASPADLLDEDRNRQAQQTEPLAQGRAKTLRRRVPRFTLSPLEADASAPAYAAGPRHVPAKARRGRDSPHAPGNTLGNRTNHHDQRIADYF